MPVCVHESGDEVCSAEYGRKGERPKANATVWPVAIVL
jgi:hypothetical protein